MIAEQGTYFTDNKCGEETMRRLSGGPQTGLCLASFLHSSGALA